MNASSAPFAVSLALALCSFLPAIGGSLATVGLPAFAGHFGVSVGAVQAVVLVYLGATTAGALAAGRLGDRFGVRRVLVAAAWLFAAASAACAVAPSFGLLLVGRAFQGLGAAGMAVLAVAAAGGAARAGRAMGHLGSMSAVGTALGPVAGGLLLARLEAPALFLVLVPPAVLAAWLAASGGVGPTPPSRVGAVPAPPCWRAEVATALLAAVMMGTLVVGPFHLAGTLGLPVAGVGLVMGVGPAAFALSSGPAGRLVDRFGSGRMARAGLVGAGAGAAALAVMPAAWGAVGYALALAGFTAHAALCQAALLAGTVASAPPAARGRVSARLNLARQLGFIGGTVVFGSLLAQAGAAAAFAAGAAILGIARMVVGQGGAGQATFANRSAR